MDAQTPIEDILAGPVDPPRVRDFDLDPPIEFNKKPFTRLHLEEPTARMVERAEQELAQGANTYTMRRYSVTLVAQTARVPREVVEMMRIKQVEECFDFLAGLLSPGPPTGAT
jgi:hypothetical protein